MNKNEAEKLIEQYTIDVIGHSDGTYSGDCNKTNRHYHKLAKIFKTVKANRDVFEPILIKLLGSQDYRILSWVAPHCLVLRIEEKQAINVLVELANNEEIGILGFNAEMVLKQWEKGELEL